MSVTRSKSSATDWMKVPKKKKKERVSDVVPKSTCTQGLGSTLGHSLAMLALERHTDDDKLNYVKALVLSKRGGRRARERLQQFNQKHRNMIRRRWRLAIHRVILRHGISENGSACCRSSASGKEALAPMREALSSANVCKTGVTFSGSTAEEEEPYKEPVRAWDAPHAVESYTPEWGLGIRAHLGTNDALLPHVQQGFDVVGRQATVHVARQPQSLGRMAVTHPGQLMQKVAFTPSTVQPSHLLGHEPALHQALLTSYSSQPMLHAQHVRSSACIPAFQRMQQQQEQPRHRLQPRELLLRRPMHAGGPQGQEYLQASMLHCPARHQGQLHAQQQIQQRALQQKQQFSQQHISLQAAHTAQPMQPQWQPQHQSQQHAQLHAQQHAQRDAMHCAKQQQEQQCLLQGARAAADLVSHQKQHEQQQLEAQKHAQQAHQQIQQQAQREAQNRPEQQAWTEAQTCAQEQVKQHQQEAQHHVHEQMQRYLQQRGLQQQVGTHEALQDEKQLLKRPVQQQWMMESARDAAQLQAQLLQTQRQEQEHMEAQPTLDLTSSARAAYCTARPDAVATGSRPVTAPDLDSPSHHTFPNRALSGPAHRQVPPPTSPHSAGTSWPLATPPHVLVARHPLWPHSPAARPQSAPLISGHRIHAGTAHNVMESVARVALDKAPHVAPVQLRHAQMCAAANAAAHAAAADFAPAPDSALTADSLAAPKSVAAPDAAAGVERPAGSAHVAAIADRFEMSLSARRRCAAWPVLLNCSSSNRELQLDVAGGRGSDSSIRDAGSLTLNGEALINPSPSNAVDQDRAVSQQGDAAFEGGAANVVSPGYRTATADRFEMSLTARRRCASWPVLLNCSSGDRELDVAGDGDSDSSIRNAGSLTLNGEALICPCSSNAADQDGAISHQGDVASEDGVANAVGPGCGESRSVGRGMDSADAGTFSCAVGASQGGHLLASGRSGSLPRARSRAAACKCCVAFVVKDAATMQ
jgi:hypothetical protein